jgi:hypothetical protein
MATGSHPIQPHAQSSPQRDPKAIVDLPYGYKQEAYSQLPQEGG